MRKDKLETNRAVNDRVHRRETLSCDFCKPNRNENAKRKGKHGTTKPKYKNKRKNGKS